MLEKSFRVATADPGAVRDNNLREANPITECRSSLMVSAVARSYVTYYATALGGTSAAGSARISAGRPSVLGRSFPLVLVASRL